MLRRLKNKEELTPEMVNIMLYATRDLRPAICTTDSQLPELDEPASKLFTSWDGFRSKVKGYLYSIVRLDRESIGLDFEEKKAFLQKARESNLLHERLNKEIQNRKTLIHCITYDMTDSLAGINKFFSTVNPNKLSPKETQYLEISKRKAQKLEELVQELIDKYTVKEGEANETDSLS